MKKWIDSNYHYMVPEFDKTSKVDADLSAFIADVKRGVNKLGASCATPVIYGPVSIVRFMNFHSSIPGQRESLLDALLPVYEQLLRDLHGLGVTEVQIHEPTLVFAETDLLPLFKKTYPSIFSAEGLAINMVSYFEDIGSDNYKWLTSVEKISVISLDFTRGNSLSLVESLGFPENKTLGVGIVDGRNVWKVDPSVVEPILNKLSAKVGNLCIQPSASLQFIPWDLSCEKDILSHAAGQVLSFTCQKIQEVSLMANVVRGAAAFDEHKAAWAAYRVALSADESVSQRVNALTEKDFSREEPFEVNNFICYHFRFSICSLNFHLTCHVRFHTERFAIRNNFRVSPFYQQLVLEASLKLLKFVGSAHS